MRAALPRPSAPFAGWTEWDWAVVSGVVFVVALTLIMTVVVVQDRRQLARTAQAGRATVTVTVVQPAAHRQHLPGVKNRQLEGGAR